MQYELFSDADFQHDSPFRERAVYLAGSVPKSLRQSLIDAGADIRPTLSRNVHYVVWGENVSAETQDSLQRLVYNGYNPKVLSPQDVSHILQGHTDQSVVPLQISKDLHLTFTHYLDARFRYDGSINPLYMKELYLAPDLPTELYQMLGNRGIYANAYIDDTTDVLVLSNDTLNHLREGSSDDTLRYIEQQYNASRSPAFRYVMTSEGELLAWLNKP